MKIKNIEIVNFFKNGTSIVDLKAPRRLLTAVSLNMASLQQAATLYNTQHGEILNEFGKKDDKGELKDAEGYKEAMEELLGVEVNIEAQTVSEETLDLMEEKDKFDALTGQQLGAIEFMIEK